MIAEFQSRQQNVAISVGVLQRGRIVFRDASGFADKEAGLRADPSMAFSIASITKAFTGAALLKLVEDGRVDLDAEIQRYVPDFPRHPSGTPITVRMLASHLSGLRHWGPERNEALYARHFDDVRDILPLFRDSAWVPGLPPLTRYAYSSYGYNALAMAMGARLSQRRTDERRTAWSHRQTRGRLYRRLKRRSRGPSRGYRNIRLYNCHTFVSIMV